MINNPWNTNKAGTIGSLTLKDHISERQIFVKRVIIGIGLLVLLTIFLVARLVYLQIIQHDIYRTLSDKNRIQVQPIPPSRGLIYDRNGELIADNIPSYNLTITTERVQDLDATIAQLRTWVNIEAEQITAFKRRLSRHSRPYEPVPLLFRMTLEEIAQISVNQYALPGVDISAKLVRHYPKGVLMAHAVGSVRRISEEDSQQLDAVAYSGIDHIGKIGVEKFYEQVLLGKVGYRRVETNARGQVMAVLDLTLPIPGQNLTLAVDSSLQQVASDALGDQRGTIVAMDPKTGAILALVSKPAYDPNPFVTGISHNAYAKLRDSIDVPLFNRATQGQYEPGSTLKPFIGLAGLVTQTTSTDYTINDPGWFQLTDNPRKYRDWNWQKHAEGGHGRVNLQKAIYRSCNIYFYQLAVKLGIDRIHKHLALFGFGTNRALDLPEAKNGLLPSREWKMDARNEPWYTGDTVNIGIGQGDILVTPLQLATAVSILANRGRMVAPQMIQPDTTWVKGKPIKNIELISADMWELIIESMEMVVHRGNQGPGENGTAWAYIGQDIPYRMAGKSGTTQVVGIAQGEEYDKALLDERQRKHAWFVAFAPTDKPQIALVVLIENGGGGSTIASPIARQVIDYYLLNRQYLSQL